MSHFEQSCKDKRAEPNKKGCKTAITGLVKAHGLHRSSFTFYHCPYCRYWHIGHRRPELEAHNNSLQITAGGALA